MTNSLKPKRHETMSKPVGNGEELKRLTEATEGGSKSISMNEESVVEEVSVTTPDSDSPVRENVTTPFVSFESTA